MSTKLHIKKGDTVFVNTGEDKGKTGRVLEVKPAEQRAMLSKTETPCLYLPYPLCTSSAETKGKKTKNGGSITRQSTILPGHILTHFRPGSGWTEQTVF
jgi:hypothetical protein